MQAQDVQQAGGVPGHAADAKQRLKTQLVNVSMKLINALTPINNIRIKPEDYRKNITNIKSNVSILGNLTNES